MSNCVVCKVGLAASTSRVCVSPKCIATYEMHIRQGDPICSICGVILPASSVGRSGHAFCAKPTCRSKLFCLNDSIAKWCSSCGIYLQSTSSGMDAVCSESICKQLLTVRKTEAIQRERFRREADHYDALVEMVRAERGVNDGSDERIVVVPYNDRSVAPLPQSRVQEFIVYLQDLAQQPDDGSEPVGSEQTTNEFTPAKIMPSLDVEQVALFNRMNMEACSMCGGKCCQSGGTHAFLRASDLRQAIAYADEPNLEALTQLYVRYIPEVTYEDSCVYHTQQGCALPRHLRSRVCNKYLCVSLHEVLGFVSKNEQRLTVGATNLRFPNDAPHVYAIKEIGG